MSCPMMGLIISDLLPYIIVATVIPVVLIGYCCSRLFRKKQIGETLPSPFQLPIVGCLPFVSPDMHMTFSKWTRKLGKVFSCRLGSDYCVVISDADLLREAFGKNVFSDRPEMHLFNIGRDPKEPESKGFIMNYGEPWKQQRKFAMQTFRNFGVGKTSFEDVIANECESLAGWVGAKQQEPFDVRMALNSSIANVISTVLFGKDFVDTDNVFVEYVQHVSNAAEHLAGSAVMNFFPWARFLPYFWQLHNKLSYGRGFVLDFLRVIVNHEKKIFDKNNIRNYTAAFLAHQKTEEGHLFTDFQLTMVLSDVFAAGFETTATTLRWSLLYMCLYPKLQKTIQDELDRNVEAGKMPRLSDREKLPWLEATLLEVQRIATIVPLGIPHATSEDTELDGFFIPKKAIIFPNFYFIHHDPVNFPDPEAFKPERFLDATQKHITATENLMQFSTGKRLCPGESLAVMELFLFFSVLLQRYTFKFPVGHQPNLEPRVGLTNDTHPFLLIATPRGKK